MKMRTVLYADEGTVLTDGTHYGTVIWLAEGASPDRYYAIPAAEHTARSAEEAKEEHYD
ncbi:MAG: hypothetical protein IJB75_02665 [Oscillospiraceae bacterium]|nr:hypothetical protein [Oscillospiraceae bacterium]